MAKRRHSSRVWLVIGILVVAGCAGWWFQREHRAAAAPSPTPTARAIRRSFSSTVLATGAVKPQVGAEVRVGARVSGKVERLHANIGDRVKAGDVIAELQNDDLEAMVAQRQAELRLAETKLASLESLYPTEVEQAQADVEKWQATADRAAKDLSREEDLLGKDSTSVQSRDLAQEQGRVARAQLASSLKTLELIQKRHAEELKQGETECARARAVLAFDQAQLSYATLVAPIDGIVGAVATQEGETVAAGLNAPTFVTIVDLARLQVDAYVDEVDIGKVRVGQKVSFTVDAFAGREFEGRVAAIYPKAVIQDNVVYYDVVISIVSPYEDLLRPEMTASVTLYLDLRENVLAVPSKALRRQEGRNWVDVVVDGRPTPREVKVGWKDGEWVEIADGLAEGDSVLLQAAAASPRAP